MPVNWSTVAPTACAIHCAATPVIVAVVPAFVHDATIEWGLLGFTILVGTFILTRGFRTHGALLPTVVTGVGVALWIASLVGFFEPIPEDVSTPIAALAAAAGLLWNARLHHPGTGDGCTCSTG